MNFADLNQNRDVIKQTVFLFNIRITKLLHYNFAVLGKIIV